MTHSQNGWPVVAEWQCGQGPFVGVEFPNGILAGDVSTIARWQIARYGFAVEPIIAGTCWGWYVKKITGSDVYSNHASGTAWDINADKHPMGKPASDSMSGRQISACRVIVAASEGVLRWGGDFSRPDPMHWEIVGGPSEVNAFANKLRKATGMDEKSIWGTSIPLQDPQETAAGALWELHGRVPTNLVSRLNDIDERQAAIAEQLDRIEAAITTPPSA